MKTYYVSSSEGSDTNNGRSPDKPFKTIERANQFPLSDYDKLLFKKGDVFYGTIDPLITATNKTVTIGSYGNGKDKPKIRNVKIVTKQDSWELHSSGVYKLDLTVLGNFEGLKNNNVNVGFIYNPQEDVVYGNRVFSLEELNSESEMSFYCDNNQYIYVKSNNNPSLLFPTLYLAIRQKMINVKSNIVVTGLQMEFGGGVAMGFDISSPVKNVDIVGNVIQYIGGAVVNFTDKAEIRLGNGIEMYGKNHYENILIKNNEISQCYDVAVSPQGYGTWKNVVVEDNLFIKNRQSFEIWTRYDETYNGLGIIDCFFRNNISINQGRGWSEDVLVDPLTSTDILFYHLELPLDLTIENNIFFNPLSGVYYAVTSQLSKFKYGVKARNNKFFLLPETPMLSMDSGNHIYSIDEFSSTYDKDVDSLASRIADMVDSTYDAFANINAFSVFNNLSLIDLKRNLNKLSSEVAQNKEYGQLVSKDQGQDYTVQLENEWTGTLTCSKNDLNVVWIRGSIIAGENTNNTIVGVLPLGFGPPVNTNIPVHVPATQSSFLGLVIQPTRNIMFRKPLSENLAGGVSIDINFMFQI